jgi:hypothetical protein
MALCIVSQQIANSEINFEGSWILHPKKEEQYILIVADGPLKEIDSMTSG